MLFLVYIDSGRAATAATVAFSFGATGSGTANVWRVSIQQRVAAEIN